MSRVSAYMQLTSLRSATSFPLLKPSTPVRTKEPEREGPCFRFLSAEEVAANEAERLRSVEHLSEPQMLAMMQMSDQIYHQAIWHKERERFSCPPFTLSTFYELKDMGLAYQPEGRRFHMLTADGQSLAGAVADFLVKANAIHAPFILGHSGASTTLRCTCGWGCSIVRGGELQRKANNAFSRHLRSIRAVTDMATALVPRHPGET